MLATYTNTEHLTYLSYQHSTKCIFLKVQELELCFAPLFILTRYARHRSIMFCKEVLLSVVEENQAHDDEQHINVLKLVCVQNSKKPGVCYVRRSVLNYAFIYASKVDIF